MYQLIFLIFFLINKIVCQNKDDRPTIENLHPSPTLIEGRKFFITCQINNSPDNLIFEWYLNERKILPNENIVINQHEDNSQLNIKRMSLEYSGEYTCKVSNSLGVQDSKSILVKLNGKLFSIIFDNFK